jgi:hypothetical protein
MIGNHQIIVDEWAEVWDLLKPYADGSFWRWSDLELDPEAVYIVGRVVLKENWYAITDWAHQHPGKVVFSNPAEGSQTILLQLNRLMISEQVKSGEILLLTSGDLESGWDYCKTDCYFSNIVEYLENISAHESWPQVYHKKNKPYDFLFLNGRLRPHRKYIIDQLRQQKLLDRALWTNLGDSVEMSWTSTLLTNSNEPVKLLPEQYEISRAIPNMIELPTGFVKHHLFGNTWGDAIVNPAAYVDTSFSLVTETIFDYPHTFRTEKIWKPMIMCHPFVVAANRGYYQDLHNAGFQTFGDLIDESFDQIDDPTDRANRVVAVVKDICYNGAEAFLQAARSACKYNYQQLRDHNTQQRAELPAKLAQYINERSRISTASIR